MIPNGYKWCSKPSDKDAGVLLFPPRRTIPLLARNLPEESCFLSSPAVGSQPPLLAQNLPEESRSLSRSVIGFALLALHGKKCLWWGSRVKTPVVRLHLHTHIDWWWILLVQKHVAMPSHYKNIYISRRISELSLGLRDNQCQEALHQLYMKELVTPSSSFPEFTQRSSRPQG